MFGDAPLLSAALVTVDPAPLEDPLPILRRGRAPKALSERVCELFDHEVGYGLWQTKTRIDAGAWLFMPRLWLLCTQLGLHSLAEAPSWIGGALVQRYLQWSSVAGLRYNDITGQLLVQSQAQPVVWPPLTLDPVDGYAVAALSERFVHDS